MAKLVIRQGSNVGAEYVFPEDTTRIVLGRRKGTEMQIVDPQASRDHAEIIVEDSRMRLRDLHSRNGTFLNERKMEMDEFIEGGDEIRIGHTVIEVVDAVSTEPPPEIPGYEILERIGRGTMGAVYKARQVSMDRVVAVKVLNADYSMNKAFVSRFLEEAQGAARLSHPNIIHVHDTNYTGKTYYSSMEYVDGTTVARIIRKSQKMGYKETLNIALQAARALGFAHGKKTIHRDIRPHTIMVTQSQEVKIADLGLTKSFDERKEGVTEYKHTGSLHYMAPEQAMGKATDVRTDVYSLGATLYHMLTGNVPFQGDSVESVVKAHTTSYLPAIRETEPDVPDSVAALVERMMARDPTQRHQTMSEVASDIEKVLADSTATVERLEGGKSSVQLAKPAVVEKRRKRKARRRIARRGPDYGGLIVVLVAAIILVILGMILMGPGGGGNGQTRYKMSTSGNRRVDPTKPLGSDENYDDIDVGWNTEGNEDPGDSTQPRRSPRGSPGSGRRLNDVDEALDSTVGVAGGAPVAGEDPADATDDNPGGAAAQPAPDPGPAVAPDERPDPIPAPAPAVKFEVTVEKALGYCRADMWESAVLVTKGDSRLRGSIKPQGENILVKMAGMGEEVLVPVSDIARVEFTRPNNADASMGDSKLSQNKPAEALDYYKRALGSELQHPYLRLKIEECQARGAN